MTPAPREWLARHRGLMTIIVVAILLVIVVAEGLLLYQGRNAGRATQAQSDSLQTAFLESDTAQASAAGGVSIRLENVRFNWSDKVYVDAGNMAVRAVPLRGATVDFDDLGSFVLMMQQSTVMIRPDVLEGMLNESVFNYPDSRLQDMKVAIVRDQGKDYVKMTGRVSVGLPVPFTMFARLSVDTKTNTMVMEVDRLKVFGFLPATKLVRWTPLHLDRLITIPPNKSLLIDGNRIMVKPFGLFPPPRINGRMSGVTMDSNGIRLSFAGQPIQAPVSAARNYVYLRGGTSQFGHFRMVDTDVLIVDQNQADPFRFSLKHYADMIPRSVIEVHDTNSVRITMPDL